MSKNDREKEGGWVGKLLSDPSEISWDASLELIDSNLHAKLATSLHKVEPMPEKPRDEGPAEALMPSSDAIFMHGSRYPPKIDSLAV